MKKIYSLLAMSTIVGASFAQLQQAVNQFNDNGSFGKAPVAHNMNKALGTTIWTNDFSNASDWVTDNASQTSPFGWNIGSTVNSWWPAFSGGITSTSGGNFAEVYNGNYNNNDQAINVTYTLTTANPIDVNTLTSGANGVLLEFQQYGAKFNDLQEVQISTDGSTFTTVYDNTDLTTFVGNNPSAVFPNPMDISVNISSDIAANPSSVYIRFSWTSNFPSDPALGAWTTFGWFIDDVKLVSLPDNDLLVNDELWGSAGVGSFNHYYKLPTAQIAPVTFATWVNNEGVNEAKNAILNVDINSGTATASSPAGVNIPAGYVDSLLEVTAPFTPSGDGTYAFTWTLTSDSTDDIPANNELVGESFEVGGFIYQRDMGTIDNSFNRGEDAHKIGNTFDCYTNETVYSIDVAVGAGTDAGATIIAKLFEITYNQGAAPTYTELASSIEYTVTSSDVTSNALKTLHLTTPYEMQAGVAYEAVVETYGGTGAAFAVATAGTSRPGTSHLYLEDDATWYYITNTPVVRMNMEDYGVSVEENAANIVSVQNFPNPFNESTLVSFNLGTASDVVLEITDLAGKVVENKNLGGFVSGTHTFEISADNLNSGVYFYTLVSGNSRVTNKMVVKK